ncbi:ATP-binding protein [Candidatus Aenigmatarchaeota archaeon]
MPVIVVGRDEEDLKKYGETGTIYLGKHLVGTGEDAHTTTPVRMDILRPHIVCITGKRGSGKSFSLGIFVEEIMELPDNIRSNLCSLIIDTQGIFWTMKSANEKDLLLLNKWDIKPKAYANIHVSVPVGQENIFFKSGVEYDSTFSISPNELTPEDWLTVFELKQTEPLGILFYQIIKKMRGNYSLDDIINTIHVQEGFANEKLALKNYLEAAKGWGIFGDSEMPTILEGGKTTVLDVSLTPSNVRALLVSLIGRSVFTERVKARRKEELADVEGIKIARVPMCWILIDEAHNFLPGIGRTPATDTLNRIVKEGRQPGITLVLATQRPEKLHPDALAQCDLILSHRLTAKGDIDALKAIMQTYMLFDITRYINELPKWKGTAIILDDNSERLYKVRVRPRKSWHAGSSPVAI